MEKKRYVLFGHVDYYPSGGMNDVLISFNTKEELLEKSNDFTCQAYDVLDTETFNYSSDCLSPVEAFNELV